MSASPSARRRSTKCSRIISARAPALARSTRCSAHEPTPTGGGGLCVRVRSARCASSSVVKVEIQFSGPAVPVGPNHGPAGTRPSSDTSPATAVAVGVASAPDRRRADEGCVVDGLSRLRGVTTIMQTTLPYSTVRSHDSFQCSGALTHMH